jgi:hypothetical protein
VKKPLDKIEKVWYNDYIGYDVYQLKIKITDRKFIAI